MRAKEILNEDWNKVNHQDKTDGLSRKAVKAYRRENPGSKLQTAVTTKPSKLKPGSKAAKRRKSFCARMSGNKGPMKKPNGKPTPKALALRRWNCESIEEMRQLIETAEKVIQEKWTQKYKSSINCSHPKGFSQRAHCAGKKKHNEDTVMEMTCPDCGMCKTNGSLKEIKKGQKDSNGFTKCWPGKHAEGTKKGKNGKPVRNCVPNESVKEDRCPQCGSKNCSCPPNTCKCKPIAGWVPGKGFKKAIDEGKTQKQEAPKPRNFVAKNATTSGAGAHKDKKKAAKQGDVKHKGKMMDIAEMEAVLEKASRALCTSSTPDKDLGASNLASCKSQGLRARDGEKSHLITAGKRKVRVTVGGKKIKGRKYGGPLPDYGTRK